MIDSSTQKNAKKIAKNTIYLTIMEGVELLIPFLALPYIVKIVGASNYGKIVFAQSLVSYFTVIVDFGLNIVATKEVATNRDNKKKLGIIFCTVMIIKLFLLCICYIALNIIVCSWNRTNTDIRLYNYCFGVCVANVLFVRWLFQGLEKMFIITLIRSSALIIYLVLVYLFLKNEGDYSRVPLYQSGCLIITSICGMLYAFFYEKIRFVLPDYNYIINIVKQSFPFFCSRGSLIVNSSLTTLMIGILMSDHDVAAYDIAQKIARVAGIPSLMVTEAIYPHNARKRDPKFATTVLFLLILFVICCLGVLYFFVPYAVYYLGHGQVPDSVKLVRILFPYALASATSVYLGTPMLVAWGHSKPFNNSVYCGTCVLLIIYSILYYMKVGSPIFFCLALCMTELVVASYRLYYCIKYNIFSLSCLQK